MITWIRRVAGAILAAAALWCPPAVAQQPVPSGVLVGGTLSFDARASLGRFTGSSTEARGGATGAADLRDVRGWVELPVATLRTGNGLRDGDMRRALEADAHPILRYDLDAVSLVHQAGDSAAVMLTGRLTIRGVTRAVGVPALVRFEPAGIRVRSEFPLNVSDYGVRGLRRMLVLRMAPDIVVRVDLLFGPGAGDAPPGSSPGAPPPASG